MKYALYVYVKALYIFYLDEIPGKLLNKLKSIERSLCDVSKKAEKQINGHPWEIIYKYIALIMLNYACESEKDAYVSKMSDMFSSSDGLIKDIYSESIKYINFSMENQNYDGMYSYMYC